MDKLTLINAACDGDPDLGSFAEFLCRKLGDRVAVEMVEMADCTDFAAIPAELIQQLAGQQIDGIPVVVLNGEVVMSGRLPNWMESFEKIEKAMSAPTRTS